jgi:hypothetical protein
VAGSTRGPAVSVDESAGQVMRHEHSPVALTNVSFGLNDMAPRVPGHTNNVTLPKSGQQHIGL